MKLHSFVAEISFFSLIFLGFVIPPIFNTHLNSELFIQWDFPWLQLIYAVIAAFIFLIFNEKQESKLVVFPVIFTVSLLFCISLFIKFFSSLPIFYREAPLQVARPDSPVKWIFCIINFLAAAFFEEIIYRFYLADALFSLISRKSAAKFWIVFCEVFACLFFAAAHLYLGVFSVINAALAHIALRFCYKKCGSIWCGVCAHFIYNVISLILL